MLFNQAIVETPASDQWLSFTNYCLKEQTYLHWKCESRPLIGDEFLSKKGLSCRWAHEFSLWVCQECKCGNYAIKGAWVPTNMYLLHVDSGQDYYVII